MMPPPIPRALLISVKTLFPATVLIVLFSYIASGDIQPTLWLISDDVAEVIFMVYAAVIFCTLIWPDSLRLHLIGAPLGVMAFLARAGGFFRLVILGVPEALPGMWTATLLALTVMIWHNFMAWLSGLEGRPKCRSVWPKRRR